MKKLSNIKKTRSEHFCRGCETAIPKGSSAIDLIIETRALSYKDIIYFHNIHCYNDWEVRSVENNTIGIEIAERKNKRRTDIWYNE
jgi:hypothetical protein